MPAAGSSRSRPASFNPRPREEATAAGKGALTTTGFQPTPPRGGDGDVDDLFLDEGSRFNPRPREEATPLC